MADSRAKARKIPDKPETSYWIKKEESAQIKTGDVKRTEKLVIERFPLAIPSIWKRSKALLYQRMLINAEEIMELENHHLRNTIIMILKMIKLLSKSLTRNQIFTKTQGISLQGTFELWRKKNNIIEEKCWRYHFNQVVKVNVTSIRLSSASWYGVLTRIHTSMLFLPKMCKLNIMMK